MYIYVYLVITGVQPAKIVTRLIRTGGFFTHENGAAVMISPLTWGDHHNRYLIWFTMTQKMGIMGYKINHHGFF
jgi:hypothetical protein